MQNWEVNSRRRTDWQNGVRGDEGIQRPWSNGWCYFRSGADRNEWFFGWHEEYFALFAALCEKEIPSLLPRA